MSHPIVIDNARQSAFYANSERGNPNDEGPGGICGEEDTEYGMCIREDYHYGDHWGAEGDPWPNREDGLTY